MKQHIKAMKDLTFNQIMNVLVWFFAKRRKWNKYHRMVMTSWYGDKAYMVAESE
jgi:hypothetical protein|tara:strand:+ start:306 stop:467 length:162 start_codon:yes stop_codon:yes gene_type:complete